MNVSKFVAAILCLMLCFSFFVVWRDAWRWGDAITVECSFLFYRVTHYINGERLRGIWTFDFLQFSIIVIIIVFLYIKILLHRRCQRCNFAGYRSVASFRQNKKCKLISQ